MKKNLLYVATISMALLFTACGGGSSDSGKKDVLSANDTENNNSDDLMTTSNNKDVAMKVGESYNMKKGDTIVKISKAPKLELNTNTKTGKTIAKLLEGQAKIKHGSVVPSF